MYGAPRVYGAPVVPAMSGVGSDCGCARENGKVTRALVGAGIAGGFCLAIIALAAAREARREEKFAATLKQHREAQAARNRKSRQAERRRMEDFSGKISPRARNFEAYKSEKYSKA